MTEMYGDARRADAPVVAGGEEDLARLRRLVADQLAALAPRIDEEGLHPQAFLRDYGRVYGFGHAVDLGYGGRPGGLKGVIAGMEACSEHCVSTGFLVWCQTSCAWYLQKSGNTPLKRRLLPALCSGQQPAGTGLSNLLKARSQLEPLRLRAVAVPGGYRIHGTLPWVSNLVAGAVFAVAAATPGGTLMALARAGAPGLTLRRAGPFCALEGTATMSCRFDDVFLADSEVIAPDEEFDDYFARMRPGLILAQMGMALGLVRGALTLIDETRSPARPANAFVEHQPEDLRERLHALRTETQAAADGLDGCAPGHFDEILALRARGTRLALDAAQSALLHCGANGYLARHPAQRRVREAYFVALVTPALKHLAREIALAKSSGPLPVA